MAHSPLATVSVPAHSGNYTRGRSAKIRCVTVHHMAGVTSAEGCGAIFQRAGRNGSSHYGIGNDGRIGVYVEEENTAWTNSNWASNCESVTIETSNSSLGGDYPVSDAAYNSLIKLVADIAKRNGLGMLVPGVNLTWHSMFVATSCPGNYLRARMSDIADKANVINAGGGQPTPAPGKKTNEQLADEVIAGKWGNGTDRKNSLTAAGYDYNAVQAIVNQKLGGGSTPAPAPAPSGNITRGSEVTLKDWVDYNGVRLRKTRDSYTVGSIYGDRAVLYAGNVVYAAAKVSNLTLVGGGSAPAPAPAPAPATIGVGSRVTLKSWVDYNGTGLRKTRDFYYVSEVNGDRAVLRADSVNGAVYAAVKVSNLQGV